MTHRFGIGALVYLQMTRGPVPARVARLNPGGTYDLDMVEGPWAFKEGGHPKNVEDAPAWMTPRTRRVPGDDEWDKLSLARARGGA